MANLKKGEPGVYQMIGLAILATGIASVELITNNLIPITLRHFTDNAFVISAILATNRLFGFVVQPYVCWKSDFVDTRFGRRRPFFIVGLPLTIVLLLLVGSLPFLIEGDARHTWATLFIVLVVNVALQAVADVNWGTLEPLYGDMFRQEQLGRAGSVRQIFAQSFNFLMVTFVIGWADLNELYPYLYSCGCLLIAFFVVLFVVKEQPFDAPKSKERYSPVKHLGLLVRDSNFTKLAFVCASNLALPATLFLFMPLFVTDTLGLSKGELGRAQILGPVITVSLAFPIGFLVDYFGPKRIMASGFAFFAAGFLCMCFFVTDFWSLFMAMTLFGIAQVLALMPMTAMVFQHASSSERGQVFGVIQFARAFTAFVLTLGLGSVVELANSEEATPLRESDLKNVSEITDILKTESSAFAKYYAAELSTETQLALNSGADESELRELLLVDFNRIIAGESTYEKARYEGVDLSDQALKLLAVEAPSQDQVFVLNRILLRDVFEGFISRKINYRIANYIGLGLAILAFFVALASGEGQYASTLKGQRKKEA